jgi:hypothetical protein
MDSMLHRTTRGRFPRVEDIVSAQSGNQDRPAAGGSSVLGGRVLRPRRGKFEEALPDGPGAAQPGPVIAQVTQSSRSFRPAGNSIEWTRWREQMNARRGSDRRRALTRCNEAYRRPHARALCGIEGDGRRRVPSPLATKMSRASKILVESNIIPSGFARASGDFAVQHGAALWDRGDSW